MAKKKVKKNKKVVNKATTPVEEVNKEIQDNAEVSKKEDKKVKETKTAKVDKKQNKNKRHWFKDFKAELKKVIWPSRKELFSNTVVVLVVVIIVSVLVFILDLIFEGLTTLGVKQLEKLQGDSNVVNEVVVDNEISENTTNVTDEGVSINETTAE